MATAGLEQAAILGAVTVEAGVDMTVVTVAMAESQAGLVVVQAVAIPQLQ